MALKKKGPGKIAPELECYFSTGQVTAEIFLSQGRAGENLGRKLWGEYRKEFLSGWIKNKPGSRPWAWWYYDSLDKPEDWKPINLDAVKMVERQYIIWGITHKPGPETFPEPPYLFESESAYLRRKKLLIKGELQRIKTANFEPKETYPFFKKESLGPYSRVDDDGNDLPQYPTRFKIYDYD